jgi:hypothetical protein
MQNAVNMRRLDMLSTGAGVKNAYKQLGQQNNIDEFHTMRIWWTPL